MKQLRLTTLLALLLLILAAGTGLAQVNYSESFDGATFPPAGWSTSALVGTATWQRVTSGTYPASTPHSGAAMVQYDSYSVSSGDQSILVTPVVDYAARGSNTPTVSLWMNRVNYSSTTNIGPLDIYINTSPNLTGTPYLLGTINPYYTSAPAVATPGWYQYTYNIPTSYTTSTNYFIFKATSDWWNNIQMDDVAWVSYPSGPIPPSALTATMGGPTTINLSWTKNAANNDVLIVYSPTGTFGAPVDGTTYSAGNSLPGGGTVLYAGSATTASLAGVTSNTTYSFRAYSKNASTQYSSAYSSTSITTPAAAPYFEGFEGITANNVWPAGWSYTGDARTFATPPGGYNAVPRTGTKFASFYWTPSGTEMYMITTGIYLEGGKQYNAFAWYITDTYSGWNSLKLKYGTAQNPTTMTQITGATVTNPVNSTYQRLAGTFTPPSNGMYFIGIICDHTTAPYYLSIDDISVNDFPQKDIAVTGALLRNADSTWVRGNSRKHVVQATIQNLGWEDNPTTLSFSYSDGTNTVTENINPTWAGNTATITFATKYVAVGTGNKTITVTSNYVDALATNNSKSFAATFEDVKTVGYETFNAFVTPGFGYGAGFTPEPFIANNVNGGNTFLTSVGTGVSGTQAVEYPGDGVVANDWLILPPAYLNAGSSYRFRLQYASQLGLAQNMQFFYSQSPDIATMQPLTNGTYAGFTNTAFKESSDPALGTYPYFNTTTATNYYIGIKVTSPANAGKLILDNMRLDVNPAPPPKIGFRYDSPATAPYVDDPSTARIDISAIYHTPGLINRRYQVTNVTNLYGSNGYFLWDATTTTPWIKITKDAALPTQGPNPFNPARPRENQYFTIEIDPTTFAPGTYNGMITLYGKLFNDEYPATGNGLNATNQPFNVPVVLVVTASGTGGPGTVNSATRYALTPGTWEMRDVNNKLLATVRNYGPNTIESFTITEYPNTMPPSYSRLRYVHKYWEMYASGDATNWTMDVDLYYTDTEANAGNIFQRGNLRGRRQPMPGGSTWRYAGGGETVNSSASYPANNMVRILNLNSTLLGGNFALATNWNGMPKSDANPVTEFSIEQNYPNPFNPSTTIGFAIPEDGHVTMTVYNSMGVEVARLLDQTLEAGTYNHNFDASNLAAGTYVYKVTYGGTTLMKTMTLVK